MGARFAASRLAWVIVERLLPIYGLGWFVVVAPAFREDLVVLLATSAPCRDRTSFRSRWPNQA